MGEGEIARERQGGYEGEREEEGERGAERERGRGRERERERERERAATPVAPANTIQTGAKRNTDKTSRADSI